MIKVILIVCVCLKLALGCIALTSTLSFVTLTRGQHNCYVYVMVNNNIKVHTDFTYIILVRCEYCLFYVTFIKHFINPIYTCFWVREMGPWLPFIAQ